MARRTKRARPEQACKGKRKFLTRVAAATDMVAMVAATGTDGSHIRVYSCTHGCRLRDQNGAERRAWHYGHLPGRGGGRRGQVI